MIRRGLRIDDDSDTEVKQERVTLDANRKRDNFEKDMDNFLFGGPPVRNRSQKKQEPIKKQPSTQLHQINKTQLMNQVQSNTNNKDSEIKVKQIEKSSFTVISQTTSKIQINNSRTQQNSSIKSSRVQKTQQSRVSFKKSQKSDIIIHKTLGQRQKSMVFNEIQGSRPNYIRKLRYPSQSYNFTQQNSRNHKFIDVVRPLECFKKSFIKRNVLNFKDKEFPASQISLGAQLQNYEANWKKCQQVFNHSTLGKYIDPNDIKKGQISSSKFLSTLSVISQRQQNIKRLIEDQILNPNGAYYVRLFINAIWRYYTVDSYFPFIGDKNGGAMSYNDNQSDLWVTLIQNAYAKVFNGYDVFSRPQPRQYYFRDLTGAPTSNYTIQNLQILNIVKRALQNKKIIAAILKSNATEAGLNPNCTVTVLGVNKKGGLNLRYSWPLIQQRSGIPISKQGIIQLNDSQIVQYISYISVCQVNRQYFTSTIQTRHQKQFYVAYKIQIKQKTHGYFTITQLDQRMFPKQAYAYEPARIFLQKKTDDKYEYVTGGFSHMSRNLDIQVQLTPGEYQLFAFVNWKYHSYDFNLSFYGSKSVDFVKIPTLTNHNLISLGLQNHNLQSGKRSALGHVHQFISYHQETNQVLITVTNTSAKSYKFQQDFKKINFQSLHLMNLTNNENNILQNYSKQELENYKNEALENRKWQIQMKAQEVFTWVISTSENYDSNNFRNWGFR